MLKTLFFDIEKYKQWLIENGIPRGDCIDVPLAKNATGHTDKRIGKRKLLTHRLAYYCFVGLIPPDLCVCHTCDNGWCINPKHLWLGTRNDNNKDRAKKGRSATGSRCGSYKHGRAVLSRKKEYQAEWYREKVEKMRKLRNV